MKRLWLALAVVLILSMSICVSAKDSTALSYARTGYSIDAEGIFLPEESDSVKKFELKSGMFSCGGDVLRRRLVSIGDITALSITLPTDTLSDEDDLYGSHGYTDVSLVLTEIEVPYAALCFGISLGGAEDIPYTLEILLSSDNGEVLSSCTFTPDEWNLVCLDIPSGTGSECILEIRLPYSAEAMPDTISVTAPYLVRERPAEFESLKKYLTLGFKASVGSASMESGNIFPDENGDVLLYAELVSGGLLEQNTNAMFEIRLSGVTGGGLSLGIVYEGTKAHGSTFYKRISLNADDGLYAIPITVRDGIVAYTLDFSNVESAGLFKIDSVRIYDDGDIPIKGDYSLGSVDHIRMTGDSVVFSGMMERHAVAQYSDGGIRYFAIAGDTSGDISTAVEIGRTDTTTIFDYTVDLSKHRISADTCMFFAAVTADDGSLIPLSSPRYAEAVEPEDSTLSNMGLYNASAAGAFESNVSHIMLDIDLSVLITQPGTADASSLSYTDKSGETRTVGISRELVRSLEKDIDFYESVGISVYLRLISKEPVSGLTHGGEHFHYYTVDASDPDAVSLYTALVRYISERYPGVAGFSVGCGVNSIYNVGECDIFDVSVYAVELAQLCRITYNAASRANPDAMILVELDEYREDGAQVSDRTLAVALARRFSEIGRIPWVLVYSIDSAEDELDSPAYLESLLRTFEIDGAYDLMYFYDPMSDNLTYKYTNYVYSLTESGAESVPEFAEYLSETFGNLCERCAKYGARTVFMSLGDILQSADHDFYSSLKNTGRGNSDKYIEDYAAIKSDEASLSEMTGAYVLCDFSDKHYNLDWISGGGVATFTTEHSPVFSEWNGAYSRVLRSSVDTVGAAGAAGIILRNLNGVTDLSGGVKLVFDFSVSGEGLDSEEDSLTVVFVVGADDYRAEFNAGKVKVGEVQSLVCDLSEYTYSAEVEYLGVMIYAEKSADFDLSRVTVYSAEKTDGELYEIFNPMPETEEGLGKYAVAVLLIIVAVVSVIVCILFVRRDREESAKNATSAKMTGEKYDGRKK